ncbi:MAG: isochorismatase family cysteine hydrolase [Bacillota bacterium]|nr:isochorismatase family cysteine hydrolase [Bacillota bacterium]
MSLSVETLVDERFLEHLGAWQSSLASRPLAELVAEAGGADRVAILVVDMIRGFATEGPLASPRVAALSAPIARFLELAHAAGVRSIYQLCDHHDPAAREFAAYPAHCVRGSSETELVPELAGLPFAGEYQVVAKNCLSSVWAGDWFPAAAHRFRRFVVVGDCTDLCVYHTAMPIKLYRDQHQLDYEVLVPAQLVDTYDAPDHPADLFHRLFLYHMALNGVVVVRELTA